MSLGQREISGRIFHGLRDISRRGGGETGGMEKRGEGLVAAQPEKKMNMYVHIYPENDYLPEHSLITFHYSFRCIFLSFFFFFYY